MGKSFKQLTVQEKEYFKSVYIQQSRAHQDKVNELSSAFDISPRTVRRWAKDKLNISNNYNRLPKQLLDAEVRDVCKDCDVMLVTAAINKTSAHKDFIASMKSKVKFWESRGKKCGIMIIPSRYRNPTSRLEGEKAGEDWWDPAVDEYLAYQNVQFGRTVIQGRLRITPTTKNPLRGYQALASNNNLIIGHPRISLKIMPRFKGHDMNMMLSTGVCTYPLYSDSGAGAKAEIHHSFGLVVLEKGMPPRSVSASPDGTFIDLGYRFTPNGVTKEKSVAGYVYGDIHHEVLDHDKMSVSDKIIRRLKPEKFIYHDVLDGYRFNPHEKKDMYSLKSKIRENRFNIKEEVESAVKFVSDQVSKYKGDHYVVQSNHDVFLDRHINNHDWKKDLHNSDGYLEYALIQQTKDLSKYGGIFGYLVDTGTAASYIPYSQGLRIKNIEVGQHGDHGVSGSRGSANSFRKANIRMIAGHSHSPIILDGYYGVGSSCKVWQPYNSKGMNKNACGDAVIYNNGKRQLIVYGDNYEVSDLV